MYLLKRSVETMEVNKSNLFNNTEMSFEEFLKYEAEHDEYYEFAVINLPRSLTDTKVSNSFSASLPIQTMFLLELSQSS